VAQQPLSVLGKRAVVEAGLEHVHRSGRDGESPPRPPVRTRRAVFPHRAPQSRSVVRVQGGWSLDPRLGNSSHGELEPWLGEQALPVCAVLGPLATAPQYHSPELPDSLSNPVQITAAQRSPKYW
jgi:hypothetical protein